MNTARSTLHKSALERYARCSANISNQRVRMLFRLRSNDMKIEVTIRLFGPKGVVPVPGLSDTQQANWVKVIFLAGLVSRPRMASASLVQQRIPRILDTGAV